MDNNAAAKYLSGLSAKDRSIALESMIKDEILPDPSSIPLADNIMKAILKNDLKALEIALNEAGNELKEFGKTLKLEQSEKQIVQKTTGITPPASNEISM